MGEWKDLNINYIDTSITTRISNLEDQYELIQYYQTISGGASGTVTIPTGYVPDLDRFGNGLDAIITKQGTDSRPFDQVVTTAAGATVTTTFNLDGDYVLSGTPSSYPVCIVFYLKGQRKYSNNLVYNNILDISTVQLSNSYTGTAQNIAVTEKALSDGLASIGGGPGGSGDVIGPATNTDSYIPQWNGANSKTLKDGLAVPAGGLAGITDVTNSINSIKNVINSTVTFTNESNYEEVTITDANILSTSNIFPHLEGSEEVAIQSIICGLKSKTTGSCVVFAGTPHGATGTYNLTVQIIN